MILNTCRKSNKRSLKENGCALHFSVFRWLRTSSVLLFVWILMFLLLYPSAWADGALAPFSKADYLTSEIRFHQYGISQRRVLLEYLEEQYLSGENSRVISDAAELRQIVESGFPETGFSLLHDAAEKCDLLFARTFAPTKNCEVQLEFLTEVNGFPLRKSASFPDFPSASASLQSGDLLFWLDDAGIPVCAGIAADFERHSFTVYLAGTDTDLFLLELNEKNFSEAGEFLSVRPQYASNDQLVYLYCVNELKYTRTGACGIVANVRFESSGKASVEEEENSIGYGICQWSFERRENYESFCREHDLEKSALESQLIFMGFELEHDYKFTGDLLRSAPDTADGAYDCGYWVCFEYEQPYDFEMVSEERAELSREIWQSFN